MLKNHRIYLISSLFAAMGLLALAPACSSDDDDGDSSDPSDQPCTNCATPPEQPPNGAQGDGPGTVLAVNRLFLGDTDRNGVASQDAWKDFGYDLDGYKSTRTSNQHCQVQEGANKAMVKTDGTNGIDNSFGANIVPVITGVESAISSKINDTLSEGAFTILLEIKNIGGEKNYVGLPAALYAGASLEDITGGNPKWDGSDEWPVFCELMNDCKESGTAQFPDATSKVQFPQSYMTDGIWSSGSKSTVSLSLSIQGFALALDINQAVITANLNGNPPNTATNGIIAGVLEAERLVDSLTKVAGSIHTSLCGNSPTLQSVVQGIRAAADIMKDGTQNPNATCDGISVGLGFEMKAVKLGQVMDKTPPGEDPCAQ